MRETYIVLFCQFGQFQNGGEWSNLVVSTGKPPRVEMDGQSGIHTLKISCEPEHAKQIKRSGVLPCIMEFEMEEKPIKGKVGLHVVEILKQDDTMRSVMLDFFADVRSGKANYKSSGNTTVSSSFNSSIPPVSPLKV